MRFLRKMLQGKVLPKCSILVTSRPSATKDLHKACSPQIQRHVEILGFTQESIKEYAASIFSAEPKVLQNFLIYISPSVNPVINSLMYIPLNAAIIIHIYRNCSRKSYPIPKTLTQVYTQLCLTLLQRYAESNDPHNINVLDKFSDLPSTYNNNFLKLAQLAFEQFEKHNVVFYSSDVPKELVHFGFLDSVPALYGGGGVSYNFLHLTLQEFLAAYHITQLPSGIDFFKYHSHDRRWKLVWRFVSGLTGFQYFMDNARCDAFVCTQSLYDYEYLEVKSLLLRCLFEGQFIFDYVTVFQRSKIYSSCIASPPLDKYALGYCIAYCPPGISWKVKMAHGSDESFMWGLNSNRHGNGVISHLELNDVYPICLGSYPPTILSGINHLDLDKTINISGSELLQMKDLTSLHIRKPISPKLLDVLFGPSSLNQLTLKLSHFTENFFDSLVTNKCLTTVDISSTYVLAHQPLFKILKGNNTIEKLRWGRCKLTDLLEQGEAFNMALSCNTKLKELTLDVTPTPNHWVPLLTLTHDTQEKITRLASHSYMTLE